MGYELHITRANFWAENDGHAITRADWLGLIEEDAELTLDERNGPLFAEWEPSSPNYSLWFDWAEGNIYMKNPDRRTLAKMLQIADVLGATVQGDEGELFRNRLEYIIVGLVVLLYVLYDLASG